MKHAVAKSVCLAGVVGWTLLLGCAARAADGLQAPAVEALWPQWQARINLQTDSLTPLSLSRPFDGAGPQRGVQGAALLGDYYFGEATQGGFRASGGLLIGAQGGSPWAGMQANSRLGLALSAGGLGSASAYDMSATATYLGLGYTGTVWHSGLALTADLGLVAERAGAAAGLGRALFGNQGAESALRDMRLSPMLQLGLRYSF